MGLYWSTPRVLGFGFGTRIGSGRRGGCTTPLAYFVLFFVVFELGWFAVHHWYVALPVAFVFCMFMAHRAKRRAAIIQQRNQSQAAVSNRR
jgi:hypothetical protein